MVMSAGTLAGTVALVTGATRGVGHGIALGLSEASATVYVTGRSIDEAVAAAIAQAGGVAIAVPCDHRDDAQVEAVFERIRSEQGRLDVLVNNAWGGYEGMMEEGEFTREKPFWEQPLWRWEAMVDVGLRGAYVASQQAARMMVAQGSGLIVNISDLAAQRYTSNVAYGVAKAATDRMTQDMALELRESNVAVVSLYPGLVRTESVLAAGVFDLSNSESPQFQGRAVAALAADGEVMGRSGQVVVSAELGVEYGFEDVDGASS